MQSTPFITYSSSSGNTSSALNPNSSPTLLTTSLIALHAGLSGYAVRKLSPKSHAIPILGSSGTAPRNGIFSSFANRRAPPVLARKICDSCLHPGHTKPDMFSTIPRIGIFAFRQKSISLRTSRSETS